AFDDDVLVEFREMSPLIDHARAVRTDSFRANRTIDQGADLQQLILKGIAFLRDQGRVRGDAIQDAGTGNLANFIEIRCIEKEFHGALLVRVQVYQNGVLSTVRVPGEDPREAGSLGTPS